ncbi:MAG: hypothetical protein ACE5IL_03895 [Myxococcota bacterium]
MRRILRSRWIALAAVCATLAVAGVVGVRPLPLEPGVVESQLSELLGGQTGFERAFWYWAPEPTLVLLEPHFERTLGSSLELQVAAGRGEARGLGLLDSDGSSASLPDRVDLQALRVRLGPLMLVRGSASLNRRGSRVDLRGHAFGGWGGRVDLSAQLAGPRWDWEGASGQLYIENLETALGRSPAGEPGGPVREQFLRLNGVVSAKRDPGSAQRFDVQLGVLGVHANAPGSWLSATLEGGLERSAAGWSSERQLDVRATLGIAAGSDGSRVLRGEARGSLRLVGGSGDERARLALELSDLQGRVGRWLDAGGPRSGRLEAVASLREGRVDGTLDLGTVRLDLRRDGRGRWRVRSDWLPLSELQPILPALRALPAGSRGEARLTARFDAARGWRGKVEARALSVPVRDEEGALISTIRTVSARLRLRRDSFDLRVPELFIGSESLQLRVRGTLEGERPVLSLAGSAGSLDLQRLARVLAPLIGTPDTELTLEAVLVPLVHALRRHPSLLAQLAVRPSLVRVRDLHGLGIDARDATIRIALRDQQLEIACREDEGRSLVVGVRVDLKGWVPRVLGDPPVRGSSPDETPGV